MPTVVKVLCMNDNGQPAFQELSELSNKSELDEIVPVLASSLQNWRYCRNQPDERFAKSGTYSLQLALLSINVILNMIERDGIVTDREELDNFLKSFTKSA